MPYTKQNDRPKIRKLVHLLEKEIKSKGDLNYAICELVGTIILTDDKIGYEQITRWIDAVHGAERELTRRLLNPYEKQKMEENGDVEAFDKIMQIFFPGDYR